jgi:DNA-binding LacI/PurR family transcriptional regulator
VVGSRVASTTIVDLAKQLGLSKTTVADALRGTGRVAPETRELVKRAAASSGYRANKSARSLRTQASQTFGLYIGADVRRMPFYMPFAFGALEAAADLGYDLTLLAHTPEGELQNQLAGAVVIDALPGDPLLLGLLRSSVPVVSAGRLAGVNATAAMSIEIDYALATRAALDQLATVGVGHPVLIAPSPRDPAAWSELIARSYSDWCTTRGVETRVIRLGPYASSDELEAALGAAVDDDVDGLFFCWQDAAERAHVDLARRRDGRRLAVATLVDTYVGGANYAHDVLVNLDALRFGTEAIKALHEVVEGTAEAPFRRMHEVAVLRRDGSHFRAPW